MSLRTQWTIWIILSLIMIGLFTWSMTQQPHTASRAFLPGVTTHGHYQIELQCKACHTPGMGVLQDACNNCHSEDLQLATDTHPRSKFTDPGKAHLLTHLDARKCTTCHREHVPDQTLAMGLSIPKDYCWHCHQDVGEQRPSHKDLAYDSCATAGCHNYHDNRALFENYLAAHFGEPKVLDEARTLLRNDPELSPLAIDQHDAPPSFDADANAAILDDWVSTAHAKAGVNCTECHQSEDGTWTNAVTHQNCESCHSEETKGFLKGRHGMRLAASLPAMTPEQARIAMHTSSHHKALNCNACHGAHTFDATTAAVESCLTCHDDDHSKAYVDSPHHELWKAQLDGTGEPGTGVSCATCHLPRVESEDGDGSVLVTHNQNDNLRPNEKMIRSVCTSCHGLQFTLDSLADAELVKRNFRGEPQIHIESINMSKAWADERSRLREERKKKRTAKQQKSGKT